jgi:hypothetical protein
MFHNEIGFLITLTAALVSILLVLLVYLIIRKGLEQVKRSRIEEYKALYNEPVFEFLLTGSFNSSLTIDKNSKREAFESLLSHYSEILEGQDEKENMQRFAEVYLSDYYREKLNSLKWSQRMNALYYIEDFHIKVLEEEIVRFLERKKISKDELVHSLRILAAFQHREFYKLVSEKYNTLTYLEYRTIFARLDDTLFSKFLEGFDELPAPMQYALLDMIGYKKDTRYLAFTEDAFQNNRGEVRIKALKSLAAIGYVPSVDPYLSLLKSPEWQERMLAAKLVGSLREKTALDELTQLLHDPVWWVRSQAGQSVMMFPEGRDVLQKVADNTKDLFARDMAVEWINRGGQRE